MLNLHCAVCQLFLSKSGRNINFKSVREEKPHYLQQKDFLMAPG